jgi:hypothetical protein
MDNKKNENFGNASIAKQLGHEDLFQFAERIVKDLSEKKYGESVVMDCGEEIKVIANHNSTVDTIIKEFGKEFEEGFQDRYKLFSDELRMK